MVVRTNKHGLTTRIPSEVARAVRRDCGYGCVICGAAFFQYEHFDPPFVDAKEHRPEGIALLCGACHDKKTKGIWSVDKVRAARKNPVTFRAGSARDAFDITAPFILRLGSSSFQNVSTIVKTKEGENWLSIESSEENVGPVRISADFFDVQGELSLKIEGNEWMPLSSQWDTEVVGRKIIVRRAPGEVALEIIAMPPNGLRLARLRMRKADLAIIIEPSGQVTISRGGGQTILNECLVDGSDIVFLI